MIDPEKLVLCESLPLEQNREEDRVWHSLMEPLLEDIGVNENIKRILYYGFTEMFNNIIDHSGGRAALVEIYDDDEGIAMILGDDGVGIFEKIRRDFGLEDHRIAIFELSKGKLTSDPARHTGEGIFFTSRAFDVFSISSGGLLFGHNQDGRDLLLERFEGTARSGTVVYMEIRKDSNRNLRDVFREHEDDDAGFSKTTIVVSLAAGGPGDMISRSQAKRVLSRCEQFREVALDFKEIDFIGQAFADEIFRVFRGQHPDIQLHTVNANEQVESMIRRAQANARLSDPGDEKAGGDFSPPSA